MNINISIPSIKKGIVHILHRYHIILFVVTVFGSAAVFVFFLNNTLIMSGEANGYVSSSSNDSFDQATIDRIKQLRTPDQADNQLDLSGRSNPFVE